MKLHEHKDYGVPKSRNLLRFCLFCHSEKQSTGTQQLSFDPSVSHVFDMQIILKTPSL